MVFINGSLSELPTIHRKTWLFLILSGTATGASWICYFKALQTGDINKVVPIDKSSTILTILFAALFLGEGMSWIKMTAVAVMGAGTFLMIQKKKTADQKKQEGGLATGASWLCYYRALQDGAAGVVAAVDKLSILITVAFSFIVFQERLTKKGGVGLVLITAGTLMLVKWK